MVPQRQLGFLSSSVMLHGRTISGKLLAFGCVAKIVTTPCRLGLLPAAQNFLASIWPLIEILRSLVRVTGEDLSVGITRCALSVPPPRASSSNSLRRIRVVTSRRAYCCLIIIMICTYVSAEVDLAVKFGLLLTRCVSKTTVQSLMRQSVKTWFF